MAYISVIPIEYPAIRGLMCIAFEEDHELLEKYTPVRGESLSQCVDRCYAHVEEMFTGQVYKDSDKAAYMIQLEHTPGVAPIAIGFMVVAKTPDLPNELYSFGINIHYRSKAIVIKWLAIVRKMLGDVFWTSLYKQNSRAINFFEKNGFKKVESECRSFVSLWSNLNM